MHSSPSTPQDSRALGTLPIVWVQDLAHSLDYYARVLGFTVEREDPGVVAVVVRGRARMMLAQGDQGQPGAWVILEVADADTCFHVLSTAGATIRVPVSDYHWSREFQVEDPDGNVLRFAAPPREGAPSAPWRDVRGEWWIKGSDGEWERTTAPR